MRKFSALNEVFSRMKLTHKRPAYRIDSVPVAGEMTPVIEEKLLSLPFGTLLHFKKSLPAGVPAHPPVLLVAPLSGHFATGTTGAMCRCSTVPFRWTITSNT